MIHVNRKIKRLNGKHRGVYLDKNIIEEINKMSKIHSVSGNFIINKFCEDGIRLFKDKERSLSKL
tara:strand:- start:128 stop:322 length:195 start_codon:yes stop_codon:yes gene_type:complete